MPNFEIRLSHVVLPWLVQAGDFSDCTCLRDINMLHGRPAQWLGVNLETAYQLQIVCRRFRDELLRLGVWEKFRPHLAGKWCASVSACRRAEQDMRAHIQRQGSAINILELCSGWTIRSDNHPSNNFLNNLLRNSATFCPNVNVFRITIDTPTQITAGLVIALSSFSHLEVVMLGLDHTISGDLLLSALVASQASSLCDLTLNGAGGALEIGVELLVHHVSNFPALRKLSFIDCESLSEKVPMMIAKLRCVTSLDLSGSWVRSTGICSLFESHSAMESFRMFHCPHIESQPGSTRVRMSMDPLAAACSKITGTSLKNLDLTNISELCDEHVACIAIGCPNLQKLSLSKTNVTEVGCVHLQSHCLRLQKLCLIQTWVSCRHSSEFAKRRCNVDYDWDTEDEFDFSLHRQLVFPSSLIFLDLEETDVCAYCLDAWVRTTPNLRRLRINTCTREEKLNGMDVCWLCKARLPQIARDVEIVERWAHDCPELMFVRSSSAIAWDIEEAMS